MAPRWPQVNNGPVHINEHATYLREACNQLQAADKGRANQIPWNIVRPYISSTLALIGKVLQQPSVGEVLHRVQDAAKDIRTIQKDVTDVKNSIASGSTPHNTLKLSGVKATTASWAQVAAQAAGSTLPPPGAIQRGALTSKTSTPVSTYKDRVVMIRMKDRSMAQRYRTYSAVAIRQHIQTTVRENHNTRSVKIIAAHQLKSGDIQIYTSTTAEAERLNGHTGWLKGLGERAELIVPTYGVIVHGVATKSIDIKDQKAVIQRMIADNYTVIPRAEISYVGWLTKESTLKRASSIVVEFTDPEMANAIIYAGMAWEGQIHQCQLYDRACRMKQCFRCYHYGHIGTQCNVSQTCGYCAEQHESKHCRQKSVEGFSPRCTVCKDAHTAWSNACPARKKERERVEQAKQVRSIYWHVPSKNNATQPRADRPVNVENTQRSDQSRVPHAASDNQADMTIHEPALPNLTRAAQTHPEAHSATEHSPMMTGQPEGPATSHEAITAPTSAIPRSGEEWTTPASQQEPTDEQVDPSIDPRFLQADQGYLTYQATTDEVGPVPTPTRDAVDGAFELPDADTWLHNLFIDDNDGRALDPAHDDLSPLTSPASEPPSTAQTTFKGCKCDAHQQIYDDWPRHDAELTIAKCMTVCVYCGVDYRAASRLRIHLKGQRHAQDNISVVLETKGRGSSTTPSWILKPRIEDANRITRTARATSRTNAAGHQ